MSLEDKLLGIREILNRDYEWDFQMYHDLALEILATDQYFREMCSSLIENSITILKTDRNDKVQRAADCLADAYQYLYLGKIYAHNGLRDNKLRDKEMTNVDQQSGNLPAATASIPDESEVIHVKKILSVKGGFGFPSELGIQTDDVITFAVPENDGKTAVYVGVARTSPNASNSTFMVNGQRRVYPTGDTVFSGGFYNISADNVLKIARDRETIWTSPYYARLLKTGTFS